MKLKEKISSNYYFPYISFDIAYQTKTYLEDEAILLVQKLESSSSDDKVDTKKESPIEEISILKTCNKSRKSTVKINIVEDETIKKSKNLKKIRGGIISKKYDISLDNKNKLETIFKVMNRDYKSEVISKFIKE